MADDRLVYLVENWNRISWFTRGRIDMLRFWSLHKRDYRIYVSIVAALLIIGGLIFEQHIERLLIGCSLIAIVHFYLVFRWKPVFHFLTFS